MLKEYSKIIKDYSRDAYKLLKREAAGCLKYPFIVPGKAYSSELWDWDSWLTNVAIGQILLDSGESGEDFLAYEEGCILNFLDYKTKSGNMAIMISYLNGDSLLSSSNNMHKPCLIQHALFIARRRGEYSFIKDRMTEQKINTVMATTIGNNHQQIR